MTRRNPCGLRPALPASVQPRSAVDLRIPFSTLMKVALFALLVFCTIKLFPVLEMVFVACLIAVVLLASTDWMAKHRIPRPAGLAITSVIAFGLVVLVILVVVPATIVQIEQLVHQAPAIANRIATAAPAVAPYMKMLAAQLSKGPQPGNIKAWLSRGAMAGYYAIEALTALIFVLVIAIYLVVEGKRTLAWLFSFAPAKHREKLVQTVEEIEPVLLAYMRGQLITSGASAITTFTTLALLRVPGALPMAILSFLGDLVPVVGFIVATIPAVLLSLIVSPKAALITLAVRILYQLYQDYILTPQVYGRAMRLSTLTVLMSIAVGGALGGPLGAILLLPVAAIYPPVERIWLSNRLADDTIEKHQAIESEDAEESERAADDVLKS